MAKHLTITKRMALEFLLRSGYRREDIRFNRRGSPDFILSDGRRVEVKRPVEGRIYFTAKQWRELDDDVEIFILHEGMEEPVSIPFREFREAHSRGIYRVRGYPFTVVEESERVVIRCSPETKRELDLLTIRLGAKSYGELLTRLVEKARLEWYPEKVY
jgi:hypothetical protein